MLPCHRGATSVSQLWVQPLLVLGMDDEQDGCPLVAAPQETLPMVTDDLVGHNLMVSLASTSAFTTSPLDDQPEKLRPQFKAATVLPPTS